MIGIDHFKSFPAAVMRLMVGFAAQNSFILKADRQRVGIKYWRVLFVFVVAIKQGC